MFDVRRRSLTAECSANIARCDAGPPSGVDEEPARDQGRDLPCVGARDSVEAPPRVVCDPIQPGEKLTLASFEVVRLEEIEEIDDGRVPFRPVRHRLGITTFGVTASTANADGARLINEHDEAEPDSSEELYVVMSGHATFEFDGERRDAPAGTFVRVAPGVPRTAFAHDAGTTVLVIGAAAPGKPYKPDGWELFAPLLPLFESGEYEEGADRAQALIANDPPYGALYYNTACFESRAGRIDVALAHLRRALELAPEMGELARDDDDLAALRAQPEFGEITGG